METYTITREPHPETQSLVLLLGGKVDENTLPELERSLTDARDKRASVSIDLSEVTLVDRKAVEYLTDRAGEGVELVNCPHYLARWFVPRDKIGNTAGEI
jgi:ABC-type transporter Mla MlaB component